MNTRKIRDKMSIVPGVSGPSLDEGYQFEKKAWDGNNQSEGLKLRRQSVMDGKNLRSVKRLFPKSKRLNAVQWPVL